MQQLLDTDQLDDKLRYYCKNNVEMNRKLTKRRVEEVMPLVQSILAYINEKDPRFSRQPVCVGSYWQNLKVEEADEFDFNVPVVGQGTRVWAHSDKVRRYGYSRPVDSNGTSTVPQDLDIVYDPRLPELPRPPAGQCFILAATDGDRQWLEYWRDHKDMVRQDDVVPFLVKKRFKQLLTMAIRELDLRDKVRQSRRMNGPALTLKVDLDSGEVSLDFTPIMAVKLAFASHIQWPRAASSQWPGRDKVAEITALGINVVAKSDFYWLLAFSHLEKVLLDGVDAKGTCRKQCHRIMKKINLDVWCDTPKQVVDSYILKTVWLWEMEKRPADTDWTQDKLAERFMDLTYKLIEAIDSKNLPMYFNASVNLLKDKDNKELNIAKEKILRFLESPDCLNFPSGVKTLLTPINIG